MKLVFGVFLVILSCFAFTASTGKSGRCDLDYDALRRISCDALYVGWAYDYRTNQCNTITLKGCGTPEMGFTSKQECELTCKSPTY
ncbi:boophilin-G2-like [Eupeodes corollae]|uniref:boophilin-G2-like n=1 Tax=Eupeodes corollae TaxID=290404 RepID=UPI0024909055|nr:boophilin-G2-like [Eupeodes corollae]